ncbi:hypothetical protein ACFVZJ_21320 [Streptomyces sp. NPDC058322]|uniref:hypothetical protein n=1 Tax=Streptomyces sp. NPDC058322 TaxID=3346446 RepID=UPI0036EBFFE1
MTTQTTAWPEGVVARYLTDAGKALTDPTITVDLSEDPDNNGVTGICHGCETTFKDSNYICRDRATGRCWAQEHAEKCRAMPKPTA